MLVIMPMFSLNSQNITGIAVGHGHQGCMKLWLFNQDFVAFFSDEECSLHDCQVSVPHKLLRSNDVVHCQPIAKDRDITRKRQRDRTQQTGHSLTDRPTTNPILCYERPI